ncbi:MAG TPA: methyltransferase domain-containing protein, partial [Bryobacteraceae bacterium]|nr:methyltransferase domain-containing protein [Bryobacteraceae bacterium]
MILLLLAGLVWGANDEEKIWRDYVEWYRKQPIAVSNPRSAYLDHLRRSGLDAAQVGARTKIIERLVKERREELHPFFFDRTYSSDAPRFRTDPNALLVEAVRDRKPGRALDVHMGQGRNAVYLASQGWDVTGFDFSEEGVRAAREAARQAGVPLTAIVRRHEEFDFG